MGSGFVVVIAAAIVIAAPIVGSPPDHGSSERRHPHLQSHLDYRVVNRRFVSHILFEQIYGVNYVTILATHGPNYHAFYARPHPLQWRCDSYRDCRERMQQLNDHLAAGHNLALQLRGSQILSVDYLR